MTDITKRLRNYLLGDQLYHPLICDEAADEIERLREVIKDIAQTGSGQDCNDIAKEALKDIGWRS